MRAPVALVLLLSFVSQPALAFLMSFDKDAALDIRLGGLASGHEEITRQAMIEARGILATNGINPVEKFPELFADLDPDTFGTKGSTTANIVIQGNFATDYPRPLKGMFYPIDMLSFAGFPSRMQHHPLPWLTKEEVDWHNNPEGQSMHALRDYVSITGEPKMDTAAEACHSTSAQIKKASVAAATWWINKGYSGPYRHQAQHIASFLIGHATHIIQDSFSPAHTKRATDGNFDIVDVCYFGRDQKKNMDAQGKNDICYHATPDTRDDVMIRTDNHVATAQFWKVVMEEKIGSANWLTGVVNAKLRRSDALKRAQLKHEARLARVATSKYLILMASYIKERVEAKNFSLDHSELEQIIDEQFLNGSQDRFAHLNKVMSEGILRCDLLN